MPDSPNYQCPACANGYLGFDLSKAWYSGMGNNDSLCRKLDCFTGRCNKNVKILRHWKCGDFPCPAFKEMKT